MRALLRYLVLTGAIVGLAYAMFVVRIGDRSMFGHLRGIGSGGMENVLAEIKDDVEERLTELTEANRPPPKKTPAKREPVKASAKTAPAPIARKAAPAALPVKKIAIDEQRVEKLRAAERAMEEARKRRTPPPPAKTTVEERMNERQKGAVSALIRGKR